MSEQTEAPVGTEDEAITVTDGVEADQGHAEPVEQVAAAQDDADANQEASADEASEGDASQPDSDEKAAPRENPLLAEGDIAADYLEELLDIADLDGDIENYTESGRAHVVIDTDGDQLVGKNGEVLEALQELARLAVMTETGHRSRLMLDIAGYRDRRRAELQALAKDAIADVLAEGEAVRLRPMNAFERKIVHDAVASAGLVSESEGEEPRRLVVVKPAE